MRLTLYQRLTDENKTKLANRYVKYPAIHKSIVEALSSEKFFTQVPYGVAFDVTQACNVNFFGDVFDD
jgi:hypothetical protein